MEMFVYFGIIACIAIYESSGQERCATPSGAQGTCISLGQCDPLLELLQSYVAPPVKDIESLREWRCDFDNLTRIPYVCCPTDSQTVAPDVTQHPNLRLINNRSCGPATNDKMLRGRRTTWDEFPWMALLAYQVNGAEVPLFRCGGTLINTRYVLTAAHCVTGLASGIRLSGIRIGEHNLSQEIDCSRVDSITEYCTVKHQDFLVQSVHVHDEYRAMNHENDIALIRINGDAVLGPSVTTSCLPIGNAIEPIFGTGLVTGWGTTEAGVSNQTMLRGNMVIVPNEECARIYKNIGLELSYKQFCAAGRKDMDSCVGDSGGPFQGPGTNKGIHYFQYGIASYGPQHCMRKGTIVYTKVAYYVKWILDTITD